MLEHTCTLRTTASVPTDRRPSAITTAAFLSRADRSSSYTHARWVHISRDGNGRGWQQLFTRKADLLLLAGLQARYWRLVQRFEHQGPLLCTSAKLCICEFDLSVNNHRVVHGLLLLSL